MVNSDNFIEKNILVLMSFYNETAEGKKLAELNFFRIKYIIENKLLIKMKGHENTSLKYNVDKALASAGDLSYEVERHFEKTDLFIALITETNVNVIYEIAVLNTLQQELLLLRDLDESKDTKAIPVYFSDFAYINFYEQDRKFGKDREVRDLIERISSDRNFDINYDPASPPEEIRELEEMIDKMDTRLIRTLQEEISKYEEGTVQAPRSFRKLVRGIHPSKALSTWNIQVPMSVLKVRWNSVNPDTQQYDGLESILEVPAVTSCNTAFVRLLGFNEEPDEFLSSRTLTSEYQQKKLSKYMSKANQILLGQDQRRIFDKLFIADEPAMAKIPLEFNQQGSKQHPHEEFRNKTLLPMLLAKKVVGIRSSPHYTYYIIAFIRDFYPTNELSEDEKSKILYYPKAPDELSEDDKREYASSLEDGVTESN